MNTLKTLNISCLENLVAESKQFLQEIYTLTSKANQKIGIIVHVSDTTGNKNRVLLYQENEYVFLLPEGKRQNALMYGNWDEALHATKRRIPTTADINLHFKSRAV